MNCLKKFAKTIVMVAFVVGSVCITKPLIAQKTEGEIRNSQIKISLGHTSPQRVSREVYLKSFVPGVEISNLHGQEIENDDHIASEAILHVGGGDVDEVLADIRWQKPTAALRQLAQHKSIYTENNDAMWGYLMEHGSPGQAERIRQDTWNQPDVPLLAVQFNKSGTEGFSIPLEQLVQYGAMWLPEHDAFITIASKPVKFKKHLASLKGQRILDEVAENPDASLDQFKNLWADFGDPLAWDVPWQTTWMGTTGHLVVTAASHGSIYKYAVDRWGNVRPDYASPHKFRLDFQWQESDWKSQHLVDGLPIIVTHLEKNEQLYELEQFAASVYDLSLTTRGYVESVMLSKVKISGKQGPVNLDISLTAESENYELEATKIVDKWVITDIKTGNIWLVLEADDEVSVEVEKGKAGEDRQPVLLTITGDLASDESKEIIIKLPAPAMTASELSKLTAINYETARKSTVNYWEDWLAQGAYFQVPEKAVNDLYRANLWHSLILPRHTLGENGKNHMDLPYANTAYGQKNADWPVNQAVYVDYMIYGLRGYEDVAQEEIVSMFQTQQEPDGRIGGYANWGVYSPGHLYTIAQNYLLFKNNKQFEALLPQAMKTLDWCLQQIAKSNDTGLILAPLNDLTSAEREWAFTQAYFVGGLELFGKALAEYNHPRADEVSKVAEKMKIDVSEEFARSSVKSAVVQLEDGTWINYVPTDAMTSRRMMDQWYPTDVDCGPLHLSRLGAFAPYSFLTTAMLHDHEDNLFLKNQGAANEPIYVQQATVYLLRDEPKAAIRSFYSLMACGFSHGQLSPLEHRWAWGQYYGPPSTDGAWFEIYRKMLVNEIGDDTLMIGQAIPRAWLKNDEEIEVKNAPTYFGEISFHINSQADQNEINATVDLSQRNPPKELLIRFRHPQEKSIKTVTVNGKAWTDYDVDKEYIRIPNPVEGQYVISAKY